MTTDDLPFQICHSVTHSCGSVSTLYSNQFCELEICFSAIKGARKLIWSINQAARWKRLWEAIFTGESSLLSKRFIKLVLKIKKYIWDCQIWQFFVCVTFQFRERARSSIKDRKNVDVLTIWWQNADAVWLEMVVIFIKLHIEAWDLIVLHTTIGCTFKLRSRRLLMEFSHTLRYTQWIFHVLFV